MGAQVEFGVAARSGGNSGAHGRISWTPPDRRLDQNYPPPNTSGWLGNINTMSIIPGRLGINSFIILSWTHEIS